MCFNVIHIIEQFNTACYWVITNEKIIESFLTATCFSSFYRAIFRLSPKKCYIQLAILYRVRDLVLNVINIYYEFKIIKLLNTTRMSYLEIRVFCAALRTKLCFFFAVLTHCFETETEKERGQSVYCSVRTKSINTLQDYRGPGSNSCQSLWNLWWKKWHWDRFIS